jgi:hypothetical protein
MIATKQEIKTLQPNITASQDEQLDMLIPVLEDDIRQYCNNGFRDDNVYISSGLISFTHNTSSADTINIDIGTNGVGFVNSQFKAGQTVQVQGSYNNDGFFDVETVSSTVMTLFVRANRPYYQALVTEAYNTFPRNILINKVVYPVALKNVMAQMMTYKLASHDYGVQSETVSRYSVTYNQDYANGYPKSIMNSLNRWRRPVLV